MFALLATLTWALVSNMKLLIQETVGLRPTFQLLGLCLTVFLISSANAGVPMPDVPKAIQGEQCVEETSFMRKNHMDLLDHQRDETMQRGIRTKKHSLNGCLTCHAVLDDNKQPVTVKNKKHFCNSCHSYAAVKIDCFGCHESTPGDENKIASKKP